MVAIPPKHDECCPLLANMLETDPEYFIQEVVLSPTAGQSARKLACETAHHGIALSLQKRRGKAKMLL